MAIDEKSYLILNIFEKKRILKINQYLEN